MADRLREHTDKVRLRNDRPQIFIGSSTETTPIAAAIERGLTGPDVSVTLWTSDDVFKPSVTTIEALEKAVPLHDFAVFIAGADDVTKSRDEQKLSPRDNVVFEIGLAMGAIGRRRTFVVVPPVPRLSIKLPSDLLSVTTLQFSSAPSGGTRTLLSRILRGKRMEPHNFRGLSDVVADQMVKAVVVALRRRIEEDGPI